MSLSLLMPLCAAAEPQVRSEMLVSTAWLAEHLHDANVVVLCICAKESFCAGEHIPGARVIELHELVTTRDGIPNELRSSEELKAAFERAGVSDGSRIVLYGESLGMLAARAYYTLDYLGSGEHAALLDGGLEKWRAERRPLSSESWHGPAGKLTVDLTPAVKASRDDVADLVKRHEAVLLDARPTGEYTGAVRSAEVEHAGHIPGAKGLYWMDLLVSREDPVLKSPDELRKMFDAAGAAPSGRVVTYCRTGMQASFSYFVAKYLGYDAAMYDGSFMEWDRAGMPVESSAPAVAAAPR